MRAESIDISWYRDEDIPVQHDCDFSKIVIFSQKFVLKIIIIHIKCNLIKSLHFIQIVVLYCLVDHVFSIAYTYDFFCFCSFR